MAAQAAASDSKSNEKASPHITVTGGGTFATALAFCFARNGATVKMVMRNGDTVKAINETHRNVKYFPDFELPALITATTDPEVAFTKFAPLYIVHAIPVQPSEEWLRKHKQYIPATTPIVNLSKGIHHTKLNFMIHIIRDALDPKQPVAALHGPSFARELLEEQPTGLVIASEDLELANRVQELLSCSFIRVYTTDDVMSVELGGALKNIYAIAAGIASGMGYKYNTAALIVSRGCAEMRRLAVAMGCSPSSLNGLSGVGDLMLTCFGPSSRNRSVGVRLGQGENIKDIIASMKEVAEGVPTAGAAVKLSEKYKVKMPIAAGVAAILDGADPKATMLALMAEPLQVED